MQTEATPKEPFTLGVLFRYKLTIVMIAILVIAGGYVRIVTQPPLYEATARLAVRFSGEAVPLREMRGDSMFRLPLLEEEVKAYMVQIKDPQFLNQVLQDFPLVEEAVPSTPDDALSKSPTALQRFKEQFLRTYYDIRRAVLSIIDAVLLTDDALLSEKEQQIMQIISRLEVTAGTEASHIIGVTYRNKSDTLAAKMVNSIASSFIKKQKKRVQPMDEKKYEKAAEDANLELVRMKTRLYELTDTLESPTLEEAIRKKYARIDALRVEEGQLLLALKLLEQNIVPFYRELPLETPVISGDLGRELLNILVRYDEQQKRVTERPEFYTSLIASARKILDELKRASIGRDRIIVEARMKYLAEEIKALEDNRKINDITAEYTRNLALQNVAQQRVNQAEMDLREARTFNEQLKNENVSENVTLWASAQVPPFPLPQHRGLKLLVVFALGILAGCAAAIVRHHLKPKRARRARPRLDGEPESPLILVPDEGRRPKGKASSIDISFPSDEGVGSSPANRIEG